MSRFHDLDAELAEEENLDESGEPVIIRLFGQDWEFPVSWPAAVPILLARWMADGREFQNLTGAELLTLVSLMVPDDIMRHWQAKGISVPVLERVVHKLVSEYATGPEGEAEPPETGAAPTPSPSSSTGA